MKAALFISLLCLQFLLLEGCGAQSTKPTDRSSCAANHAPRPKASACGLRDRGTLAQNCEDGKWVNTTTCIDPDGPLSVVIASSRTTGVAPLAVFFDSAGTTSAATGRPFHEINYEWDFGDPGSGKWSTGSRGEGSSRNNASGPVAAHIFEKPGTYVISLLAFDGTKSASGKVQIVVNDPDSVFSGANTRCFSATGQFGGCPAGAQNIKTSDFASAINSHGGSGRRLLFRRGDTFSANAPSIVQANGPGIIGAFGAGALPQIKASSALADGRIVQFGDRSSVTQKDWRVMDLSFNGNSVAEAIGLGGGFDQITILRVSATNCGDACIFFNSAVLNVSARPHLFDQAAIVDCNITDPTSWGVFFNGRNFALMGNIIDNQLHGSHTLRISIAINGVISNNTLVNNGPGSGGTHVLKLHGPPYGNATDGVPIRTSSSRVVISDNKIAPGKDRKNNWTVAISPQDSEEDERLTDILFERNWITGGANTSVGLEIQAVDMTIRNNLFDTSAAGYGQAISVQRRSPNAPAPAGIDVYNNTFYDIARHGVEFIGLDSSIEPGGASIKNNLGYAPNSTGTTAILTDAAVDTLKSNNSSNAQLRSNPNFAVPTPANPRDFVIRPDSPARNSGAPVPVFSDFFGPRKRQNPMAQGFAESP